MQRQNPSQTNSSHRAEFIFQQCDHGAHMLHVVEIAGS